MSKKTILIKGDVSGIQEFIFNVKSEGAARELKGRSFFVKLLVEISIKYLLDAFGFKDEDEIKRAKVSTSGGNFILQIDTELDYENIIIKAQNDFSKALEYTGLKIGIVGTLGSGNYQNDLRVLDQLNRKNKYKFYLNSTDYFEPFEKSKTNLGDEWKALTNALNTNTHFDITESQPSATNLEINHNKILINKYIISFHHQPQGIPLKNYLESLIPKKKNNEIKFFEDLSKTDLVNYSSFDNSILNGGERGIEKLGILAMDVDGLGTYMQQVESAATHSNLDKKLRNFFNDELSKIINNTDHHYEINLKGISHRIPKFKNKIYAVTAGGDDSLFVGKWNTILDFAKVINTSFTNQFQSEELTISAGFIVVDAKFPVIRFGSLVASALKKAKYEYENKGNICLFGQVVPWSLVDEIYKLRNILKTQNLSSGLLSKARTTYTQNQNYDTLKLEDVWKMGYYLRDVKETDKDKILKIVESHLTESITSIDKLRKHAYRHILPISARLAELDKR